MASGDTIVDVQLNFKDKTVDNTATSLIDFMLISEQSSNLFEGSMSLSIRGDATPYGQGWPNGEPPFVRNGQYRMVITEI